MRSGTSCFNWTIFKKTLTRYWALWAAHLVIWVICLPMAGLLRLRAGSGDSMARFAWRTVTDYTGGMGCVAYAAVAGALVAMAVCSHLYNHRSANFMGALPVRREGLFLCHYLAGLAMLIVPNCAVFLLTLPVEAAGGTVALAPLAWWLAVMCGTELFFYSFAVCIGMFTGHIIVLPVFYAIFNFLAGAGYLLLNWMMTRFYYGFDGFQALMRIAVWLTPTVTLSTSLDADITPASGRLPDLWDGLTDGVLTVQGGTELAIYAAVGVVLAGCALLLYRRRQLESAGDVVSVRVMRPVFRYAVAICGGLSFGLLISSMLDMGEPGMAVSIILWGVVSCFVAQMLLDKSFRVFRKWKGAAAVAAVFIAAFLVIGFDLTGYETRVPDADQVTSVTISGLQMLPYDDGSYLENLVLTDQEDIRLVCGLHAAVAAAGEDDSYDADDSVNFRVTYRLSSGATIRRYYSYVQLYRQDEGRAGTVTELMARLCASESVIQGRYAVLDLTDSENYTLDSADIQGYYLERADAAALLAAVRRDLDEGNLGVHTFSWAYDDPYSAYLSFTWRSQNGTSYAYYDSGRVAVVSTARHTIEMLETLGRRQDPDFDVDAFLREQSPWPETETVVIVNEED